MNSTPPRSLAELLGESMSLLCFMAFYGPPVFFIVVPWLLLALMLMGPFTLILTLVVALVAATAVVAGVTALAATPFLLLRRWLAQPRLTSVRTVKLGVQPVGDERSPLLAGG